jgi:hypothetical protein
MLRCDDGDGCDGQFAYILWSGPSLRQSSSSSSSSSIAFSLAFRLVRTMLMEGLAGFAQAASS